MQLLPFRRVVSPLMAAVATASLLGSLPAHAFQFDFADGEVTGSLDSTVSYGALWRVTGQDKENIGLANGGTKPNVNYDNGDLNYKRGEMVSSLFKMTNDLDLNYKNFGAFLRVTSFYDRAIESKSFNPNRSDERVIHNRLGHDYEILDAYIRGRFQVAGKKLDARIGKQVVSWGESTFIPNGINSINPVDVSKLRAPGSELKEAFLPVNMLWLSQELSDNVTVEAFNQFEHKKTRLDPNGSYFSSNDFLSPGGHFVVAAGGDDPIGNFPVGPVPQGLGIPRAKDNDPRDASQYGVAARILAPKLNNTEFGLYFMNYHSRTPYASGTTGPFSFGGAPFGNNAVPYAANYFADYPENIKLYGLSFNTPGPFGIALQGEYSYRPRMPLQIGATDLLNALLTQGKVPGLAIGRGPIPLNTVTEGFRRVKFHQLQMTGTKSFGPQLKADQVVAVVEAGYTYMDLPSNINGRPIRFNGPGLDRLALLQGDGFATQNSYGYRLVARADYSNAIGPINVSPRVAFAHDLRGTSPTFNQGVQAATVGLGATYQSSWAADIAYTNFFGGETYDVPAAGSTPVATRSTNNPLSDRDFISATISYSF